MMWPDGGGGYSPFFWIMPLLMVVFWTLVIVGLVLLIRSLVDHSRYGGSPMSHNPIDILKQRYARGEITKEQFDSMKKDLM